MIIVLSQWNFGLIFLRSTDGTEVPSIAVLVVTAVVSLSAFVKFAFDGDAFGFFRYSFRIVRVRFAQ